MTEISLHVTLNNQSHSQYTVAKNAQIYLMDNFVHLQYYDKHVLDYYQNCDFLTPIARM